MNLSFIAAFAALKVSFPGACPGKDGSLILTKRQIKTGDNALLLTAFALAFSPVSPLSVAAFAALKVSFPGACPGKDDFFILTKRQHPHFAWLVRVFSPPLAPTFGERREDNRIRLRLFCFLPVNLVFVAAFAALKVSFPGACPGKDDIFSV